MIETEIVTLKQDVAEIKCLLKEHVAWESDKYDNLAKKFAAKWVESVSIAVVGSVLTAVIVGVIYLL